ncbi:hypothetical protein FY557_15415 [Chryseobacterium sp. SN22]|uniref:hypothetical protein n=1 Tax=Chryseobacterium sp. SN22 TaxID=2606431 RepID=UPI0011EBB170|nr:hypothetical protein [Chryseobacterium sp. SN22]KAA0126820.1 hypothetical protein FY557_15415 [Chryseobacterium sp. SN22]
MTTNNKQNNSQTLFRFVSLRNPQLTETKDKNLGFIHRKDGLTGIFDSVVAADSSTSATVKFSLMEKEARAFSVLAFKNESVLENDPVYKNALKVGRKISKNELLTPADESLAISAYENTDDAALAKLWNNLIYQVVTQKDFYVKEAIIHVLKALHFGFVCKLQPTDEYLKINGADLKAKALEAKVVLPLTLFGDGATQSSSVNGNSFQVDSSAVGTGIIGNDQLPAAIQQQLKTAGEEIFETSVLELQKNELIQLKLELEKIQKTFYKLKAKQQDAAYQIYRGRYQSQIDEYQAALDRIEAQIHEGMSQEEIDALYATLQEPSIPLFKFEYRNELNFEDLASKLSPALFSLFVEKFASVNDGKSEKAELDLSKIVIVSDKKILVDEVPVLITDEYDTFAEVYEKIDEDLSSKSEVLLAKSPAAGQEFARIGNVLVPLAKTTYTEVSGTYYLKVYNRRTLFINHNFLTFYYNTDSSALGLLSANVQMAGAGQNFSKDIPAIDVVDGKVIFPVVIGNLKAVSDIKITLYFKNGEYTVITHSNVTADETYTGKFSFRTKTEEPDNPGDGTDNPGEGGTTPETGSDPKTVTLSRKNFGIKRLGVADYMKVVQSTHAYVPGEVTHIENVMAKEFKQKSTRRLRRSEIQTTTSKSTERENLNDTTSTTRNDMQSEVANVIQSQINAEAHFRYGGGDMPFEVGGSFATSNAKETSTRQAVAKSQEITEKATERIFTKVAEERIEKIIEEFEENNAHGFDNRNGDKHVVGIYRWVDKKMKNQIYNYGIRTMFEFMIPEPAKLHRLATFATKETLKAPVDPRKSKDRWEMQDPKSATNDQLQYWANYYGVTLTKLPESNILYTAETGPQNLNDSASPRTLTLMIPDNYKGYEATITYAFYNRFKKNSSQLTLDNLQGGLLPPFVNPNKQGWYRSNHTITGINVVGNYAMQYAGSNGTTDMSFVVKIKCTLSDAYMASWKQENFDLIIKAYEDANEAFLTKQKEADEKAKEEETANKEKVSNFYRDMERVIIKHNCIAYLLQDYLNNNTLGQTLTNKKQTMKEFSVLLGENLDQYTALAKFLEQAFEWTIMDYSFYPYYWADRDEWQTMYLSESTDPLFRSFLQAGMARVVVTVNPGFEDAVQFFMATGKVWNGGEVPVIGDPMYMSIVDEMRQPMGVKQGKAWITTLPTSLNILQKDGAGLETLTALPFSEEDPEEFEVPADVVTESDFAFSNAQLNSGEDKFIDHIELNGGFLQLTNDENPKEVIAQLPLEELKKALQ